MAFNVLTTVFTGGAGSAAKTGAVAKTVSALGKVGRAVDPMTYVFQAGKFGVGKVGDLFTTLKTLNSGAHTDILSGAGHLQPDGTYLKFADDVPVVKGDVIEWPNGARLDTRTNKVYKPNGLEAPAHAELSQADLAQLKSSLPHAPETPLPGAESPVLVAAGERAGHGTLDNAARNSVAGPTAAHEPPGGRRRTTRRPRAPTPWTIRPVAAPVRTTPQVTVPVTAATSAVGAAKDTLANTATMATPITPPVRTPTTRRRSPRRIPHTPCGRRLCTARTRRDANSARST